MSGYDDEYRQLRGLDSGRRRDWLREHAPAHGRGHWWLALFERAEFDASPLRSLPEDVAEQNLEFAIELIDIAVDEGMPAHYAVSRLVALAQGQRRTGRSPGDLPAALTPDAIARRAFDGIALSESRALEISARRRRELLEDDDAWIRPGEELPPRGSESRDMRELGDLESILLDLAVICDDITEDRLASRVRRWLDLRDRLEPGEDAARRGRDLLADRSRKERHE